MWYSFKDVSHSTAIGGEKFRYSINSGLSFVLFIYTTPHNKKSCYISTELLAD